MYNQKLFRIAVASFLSFVMVFTLFGYFGSTTVQAATFTENDVVNYAKSLLGKAYKDGATGPKAFDNWAYTDYVYNRFGIDLKNGVYGQSRQGEYIKKGQALRKGDLVFFGYSTSKPIHVGIYIGDNKFIDAYKYSNKVAIHTITGSYKNLYLGARRVLNQAAATPTPAPELAPAPTPAPTPEPAPEPTPAPQPTEREIMEQKVVEAAQKYLGVNYKLGGDYDRDGTYAFDCSGYVKRVFDDVGIKYLPRSATKQYAATKDRPVAVTVSDLKPGDLLFFDLNQNGGIDHNGIYIGNGKFIHASTANGGKVQWGSITENRFWKSRVIKATRVFE